MSLRVLGLIPARAGSERLSNKNILPLGGKPLLAWTIEAARAARTLERVIVSTDGAAIADVARAHGAETPFVRPSDIARTESPVDDAVRHALDWLLTHEAYEPDVVALLYPTSPFRGEATIDRAVRLFEERPDADSLRSVKLCSEHPHKMWTVRDEWLLPFLAGKDPNAPTPSYQVLPTVYVQNASLYLTRPRTIRNKGSLTGDRIVPFVMSDEESIDINTPLDLELAELWLARRQATAVAP